MTVVREVLGLASSVGVMSEVQANGVSKQGKTCVLAGRKTELSATVKQLGTRDGDESSFGFPSSPSHSPGL